MTQYEFNTIKEAKQCLELMNTRYDLVLKETYAKFVMHQMYPNLFKPVAIKSVYQF